MRPIRSHTLALVAGLALLMAGVIAIPAQPAASTPVPTVTAPATPPVQPQPTTPPVQVQPAGRSVLPWVMAVAVPALLAAVVGGWLWYRRRHLAGPRRHGRPRPAH